MERSKDNDQRLNPPTRHRPRRAYTPPVITEYGSVQELTRGSSGPSPDKAGKRRA